MKRCSEVMTKDPICCLPSDIVSKVAWLMKSMDIGLVPVVENYQARKLIGILTDRDQALRVVAEGRDANATKVEEVMTRDVVTCGPDDDVRKAIDAMIKHQVRRIPIVDENNRILGIISQADLARGAVSPKKIAETIREISKRDNTGE